MTDTTTTSVCIIGAGSVGIVTGYHLSLSGAAITYLVRPHGLERLSRPQLLYSYDDQTLRTFTGYDVVTEAKALEDRSFDFVFITLDGATLQTDSGQTLVEEIGRIFRGTSTGVLLASQGIGLRSWFIERSGLSEEQVTHGNIASFAYEAQAVTLPLNPGVKAELLAKADYGYRNYSPAGFLIDTSAPKVARDFAGLYDRNGQNTCNVVSQDDYVIPAAMICLVHALKLLDWPSMQDVDPASKEWRLGSDAMREMQRLSVYGQAGITASETTTAESNWELFRQVEDDTLPLDYIAFTHYHHGGKLEGQSNRTIRDALARGHEEGLDMPAMSELVKLVRADASS